MIAATLYAFVLLVAVVTVEGSGYVVIEQFPTTTAECDGSPMAAAVYQTDTCYVSGGTSYQYTYTSNPTAITYTEYSDTACTSQTSQDLESTICVLASNGYAAMVTYSSGWPGFSSSGLFQKQYFTTGCTGNVVGIWMENNQCIPDETSSEKVVVSGDQATLYLYSSSTGCSGSSSSFPNEVQSSCTAITSGGVTGTQSMTSYLTGQSSSSSSGSVGALTGQQVIWVMIAVLFGAAVCGAGLFTMLCPHCIKDGFGGDNSRPDTTK